MLSLMKNCKQANSFVHVHHEKNAFNEIRCLVEGSLSAPISGLALEQKLNKDFSKIPLFRVFERTKWAFQVPHSPLGWSDVSRENSNPEGNRNGMVSVSIGKSEYAWDSVMPQR